MIISTLRVNLKKWRLKSRAKALGLDLALCVNLTILGSNLIHVLKSTKIPDPRIEAKDP